MHKEKLRMLQVVFGFGEGGAELKLLELLSLLNRDRYDITVVSVGKVGGKEKEFRALGFPTLILNRSWRFDPSLPFRLAKLMKQKQIEVLMSTLFYADIICAAATLLYRPKFFLSWETITGRFKKHQIWLYQIFAARFDMVVAVSQSIHDYIIKVRKQDQQKITTIYYGVDLQKFPSVPTTRKKGEPVIFGTVARLVEQKGYPFLLQAIPFVLKEFPETRWRIIGFGPKEEELHRLAEQTGVSHAVEFLGKRQDIAQLLREIDVFVLPSLWEGFPNSVLEAMACAKPVIATSVEGTRELVAHEETGLLIPKMNSEKLAQAMLQILRQPELVVRFGTAGRRRVEQFFSLSKQVQEFEALYDKCGALE